MVVETINSDSQRLRREKITEIIDTQEIHSIDQLLRKLGDNGINTTEATISRDLHLLGIGKKEGLFGSVYILPKENEVSSLPLASLLRDDVYSIRQVRFINIIDVDPAAAKSVALRIEQKSSVYMLTTSLSTDHSHIIVYSATEDDARMFNKVISDALPSHVDNR